MTTLLELTKEMELEARTTRNMLSRVPADKFNWQPHPKSMTLGRLATHVAEIPGWVTITLTTSQLDIGKDDDYKPFVAENPEALSSYFEEQLSGGLSHLADAEEAELAKEWTLLSKGHAVSVQTKAEVIRMAYCQIVHHRAQLGVFLRLLDVPIPGSYGPSADEGNF
ncbi:DinB family protein [Dinghuibacter silviterrae]|uniref:Putative damage-inducible protein DinB n=1 Tax=Dinghuibacter silviterrae TaxID=1539049 RepID=A0A4R8DRL9_9BACT|nr:DinB family protein [Dinghuibacter silviterrae]TDX00854.1 putative damage-inducible protein DinB [Dinghuibacter silviterrae]